MSDLSRNTYSDIASGDTAVHEHLSDRAFLAAICEFEKALADAAAAAGQITPEAAATAHDAIDAFDLDDAAIASIAAASAAGGNSSPYGALSAFGIDPATRPSRWWRS